MEAILLFKFLHSLVNLMIFQNSWICSYKMTRRSGVLSASCACLLYVVAIRAYTFQECSCARIFTWASYVILVAGDAILAIAKHSHYNHSFVVAVHTTRYMLLLDLRFRF